MANRPDAVPCDDEELGITACPYYKRQCGSPGDTSESGCGLASDNVQAVEFYPRWKVLGQPAFDLLQLDVGDELDADAFVTKLMIIDQYSPAITAAKNEARQEATPEKKKSERQSRRDRARQKG